MNAFVILILLVPGCAPQVGIPASRTSVPFVAQPAPWSVFANQGWQDAHTFVHPGDVLEITASGTWSHDPGDGRFANGYGPGGVGIMDASAILPSASVGSLVGRIGDDPPFAIGEHLTFTAAERGELSLSMNDKIETFAENIGYLEVTIHRTPKPVEAGTRLTSTRDGYTLVYPEGYFVVITPQGICLMQNSNPQAVPCDVPPSATLEIRSAEGQTAEQVASEVIHMNDPNFQEESHAMVLDGEPTLWISRTGNGEVQTLLITVHTEQAYIWSFRVNELHPSLGQEDQVMNEAAQAQRFYDTVINSFQFLE